MRRHCSIGMISPVRFEAEHPSDGASRLTACPPNGVSLTSNRCAVLSCDECGCQMRPPTQSGSG